ncbi:motility associated factor glycosyltransferase family protein [Campylobacter sp. RM9344]|uniref:Motility associated factor glycosyltransferase family protein n=1 Tax=Campylobacter californiensis TaxID=1032243 RepID=A0AAW3ZVS9_9BACT|nr:MULTISPECIES: 6-hydroxymethylpterin diphosphokinase MptE-like protein [unclassified Campylobacter]MBE2984072.1 motility associated factor glycosyltransferase family protein [Campylobacter sp. RM6883]MBE2995497.1 motility associated factor glycosyltransferase family protein [Campylobacter sp. RM6913]MBE3029841.1 motility associated factor glycosyltransferase family protein [Campylobacter sp. RM9344]MBE3607873.1 motility associated factor glycosyltransferase family protein [Campylobacter sp. R
MAKKTDTQINSSALDEVQNPIFRKNLQALFKQDEILAVRLLTLGEQKQYEVFVGKDPIDINMIDKNSFEYIYEKPARDTEQLLSTIGNESKRYPVMFFYGLGNGVFYKAMLHNQTHKHIIVIEPELEILYITLNLIDLSEELANERLILFYSDFVTYSQIYHLMVRQVFMVYAKTYTLHIHTPFYDKFADDYAKINKHFTRAIAQVVASHGNSVADMLQGIDQHIRNLPQTIKGYVYFDLIKKRKDLMKTAVIVATGPSLDKQLEALKKFAPYVTVISLDASYPILAKHGIKPDYVTSIERVVETSSFFKKRYGEFDKDIYFVVASLTHSQTVKNILPRRLILTIRPQAEKSFKLDKHGYLGLGLSTANQAFQLANALGHTNIVLIGQDLAFASDGKSHATGHAFVQQDEYIYTTAYGGKGEVRTTYVWDKFKNQYESDIESFNKKGIKTFNCTEGGAMIKGAIERPFIEVMTELSQNAEIKNLPHIALPKDRVVEKELLQSYNFIERKLKVLNLVKNKIEEVFLDVVDDIDKMIKIRNEGNVSEKLFKKLVAITNKIDKAKMFAGKKEFRLYIEYILSISVYYQELELAKISVAPSETTLEKTNKLIEWVEMHKYWLFSLAGGINAEIETTKKASKNLINEMKKRNLLPIK